jgi:hypothetical protein
METCTIETGLLRKKPCGSAAVAHCLNCEQALCSQHAVAQKGDSGANTGKFLCKECAAAWKEQAKSIPAPAPKPVAKPAAPAGAAPKPAAPAAAAAKPAAAKPAEAKKEETPPAKPAESSGMIEFTPTKKP